MPFCGRTFKKKMGDGNETICGKHWRLLPRHKRRRYSRLVRFYKTRIAHSNFKMAHRVADILDKEWDRLKIKVIERAMGITA